MATITSSRRTDRYFFPFIWLVLALYALLGFWHSYFGPGLVLAPLPSLLVHIHAILFVGWTVFFGIQIGLIESLRVATHRKLGALMAYWAAAMVVVGPATVVMAVRRPESGIGASILGGDLAMTIAFTILISAGLAARKDAPAHKRLMTLASAVIMGPALARWPFAFIQSDPPIGLDFLAMLPTLLLVTYDIATLRRVHRVTWLGLGLILMIAASFPLLPAWGVWQRFTTWIVNF
jgi:hypothetical protein